MDHSARVRRAPYPRAILFTYISVPARVYCALLRLDCGTEGYLCCLFAKRSQTSKVPIDDGPGGDPPKLRVLYIDIECPAEPDEQGARFPTAKRDAITHISAVMGDLGEPNPIVSSVLALVPRLDAHVAHLIHTHVIEFAQESVLIDSWHALVNAWDPDVIATYNGEGFDFPYIIDRGYQVGCKEHTDFSRRKCSSVG